jgi:NADPH:quinone reductase-like Zn-dependent oxidoreductase
MTSAQALTMKQWVTDYSGLTSLKREIAPVPEPGEDEVLVKINAVSLNFRDVEGKCSIAARLGP